MSVSHWGIFPGYLQPANRFTGARAFFVPVVWDVWCCMLDLAHLARRR